MTTSMILSMFFYAVIFFLAGVGWGQWWSERAARKEAAAMNHGRITLSVPATKAQAAVAIAVFEKIVEGRTP